MPVIHAIVLGAVQGLTEFIPISSSGHLVIVPALFGWSQPTLAFDVLLHLASLVALLIYFSGDLIDIVRGVRTDPGARRTVVMLIVGTIPAVIVGVLLRDFFAGEFENAHRAALQLLITAAILVGAELVLRYHQQRIARSGARLRTLDELNVKDAAAIGVAQAISIIPGISRSGATIGTGLALGVGRDDSARFAFLLAIPALAGASIVELPDLGGASIGLGAGIGGFVVSLVTSYLAIAALIRYLKSNTLYPFAVYCVIAGIVFALLV